MRQYIPDLMPLIVDALLDGAAVKKREVAVSTLGQVVQSTGYNSFLLIFFYNSIKTKFNLLDEGGGLLVKLFALAMESVGTYFFLLV